jgi:hypothetical protein
MATAKRLYLYTISGISLGLLLVSVIVILRLLINRFGVGPQPATSTLAANADRDTLSLAIAGVAVALTIWLVHWALVDRMVRSRDESGAVERASKVRSVYFTLTLYYSLSFSLAVGIPLAANSVANVLGATEAFPTTLFDDAWALSIAVVFGAAWAYHAWVRARDLRMGTLISGAAAWIARLYLYLIALVAVVSVLSSLSSIIGIIGANLAAPKLIPTGVDPYSILRSSSANTVAWWVRPIVSAMISILAYGALWLSHWLYSNRLRNGQTEQSALERTSRVRTTYFMLVVLAGAYLVATGLISGLASLFIWVFGVSLSDVPLWYSVLVPPISTLPVVAVWWLHGRRARAEAPYGPAGVSPVRVGGYLISLVGVAAFAGGSIELISTAVSQIFTPAASSFAISTGDFWKWPVSAGLAAVVVGLAFWLGPWIGAQRRRAIEWVVETRSSARAYYVYFIAAVSILAGGFALAFTLSRYLRLWFGLDEKALASEVNTTVAIALVGAALFAYHVRALRQDRTPPPAPPVYGYPAGPGWPAGPMGPVGFEQQGPRTYEPQQPGPQAPSPSPVAAPPVAVSPLPPQPPAPPAAAVPEGPEAEPADPPSEPMPRPPE